MINLRLEFKLEYLWIGAYWRNDHTYYNVCHLFICIIPCFPIHITWLKF